MVRHNDALPVPNLTRTFGPSTSRETLMYRSVPAAFLAMPAGGAFEELRDQIIAILNNVGVEPVAEGLT